MEGTSEEPSVEAAATTGAGSSTFLPPLMALLILKRTYKPVYPPRMAMETVTAVRNVLPIDGSNTTPTRTLIVLRKIRTHDLVDALPLGRRAVVAAESERARLGVAVAGCRAEDAKGSRHGDFAAAVGEGAVFRVLLVEGLAPGLFVSGCL